MTQLRFGVEVDCVDPIAGRVVRGPVVVDFTGWLDFLRVVADALRVPSPESGDVAP